MERLHGKRALGTGTSQGSGAAAARLIAVEGVSHLAGRPVSETTWG